MVHTVGIFGVNGNVGAAALPHLVKAAEDDRVKLVVFHRQSSNVSSVPASKGVKLKVLDYEDPPATIEQAVKGINVFVSVVGPGALPHEPNLVNALSKSPDLVTYIPALYSTKWDEKDFENEQLGPILKFFHSAWDLAKEKEVGTTVIYAGVFEKYFFELDFAGTAVRGNTIWASERQMKHRIPVVTMEHLGSAIARIATSEPQSIRNKEFSAVTFWPTGDELRDLFTVLHGTPPHVKDFTAADRDEILLDAANFGAVRVGYIDRWIENRWGYETDGGSIDPDADGHSLEDVARKYL